MPALKRHALRCCWPWISCNASCWPWISCNANAMRARAGCRVSDCLLQLEDEEVALRGYADVHAALAAVLYTGRLPRLCVALVLGVAVCSAVLAGGAANASWTAQRALASWALLLLGGVHSRVAFCWNAHPPGALAVAFQARGFFAARGGEGGRDPHAT
jgi:hypothetical protein